MSPGRVVRIRVNPADCLSAIDVLEAAKISTINMSFDQVVRLALSILLEQARVIDQIPRREGYEYLEMMSKFATRSTADAVSKLARTRKADLETLAREAKDMPAAMGALKPRAPETDDIRKARILLEELTFRVFSSDYPDAKDFEKVTWLTDVVAGTMTWHEYQIRAGEISSVI